jgi:hypothetical protein
MRMEDKMFLRTSCLESSFTGTQRHTFIDKDYIKGDVKWGVNNMEAFTEFEMSTVATAQHLLGYRLRLAQQWRRWILKRQSVHLGQAHGDLPVVCEHSMTNYNTVIQAIICVAEMRVKHTASFILGKTQFFPQFLQLTVPFHVKCFMWLKFEVY